MRLPFQSTSPIEVTATETRRIPRGQILGPAGLAAIVLLAAVLRFANLAIATGLLAVASFSWAIAVDLTPASQRPYVGSSGDSSEISLIFGYNGINRLLGRFGRDSSRNQPAGGSALAQGQNPNGAFPPPASNGAPQTPPQLDGNRIPQGNPPQFNGNGFPQGNRPQGMPGDGQDRAGNGGLGGFNIGQQGALRLFVPPLSQGTSWLLPFGIVSMLVLAIGTRWRWPVESKHQALILWGGCLLTAGVFFSVAGFFHEYYLSMMAAPLAALVSIGIAEVWRLRGKHPWRGTGLFWRQQAARWHSSF